MSAVVVRPYLESDREAWEALVHRSSNATFVHGRTFLDIAASSVEDRSLVVERRGRLVGLLPAAVHPSDVTMLDSHPSTSYGGLVHDGSLGGPAMLEAFDELAEHAFHDGFDTLRYKAAPLAYQAVPAQDDLYALFRRGAVRSRCELASVIDLGSPTEVAKHRRRHLARARRAGIEVVVGLGLLSLFWEVLVSRLSTSHQAAPQHTLADIEQLGAQLPARISCVVARHGSRVVAGAVVLRTGHVDHAQYLAADDVGYRVSALDLVIEHLVDSARARGVRFVSLGTTTLHGGRSLNEGLHRYKSEFGAGSLVHETYDLPLR